MPESTQSNRFAKIFPEIYNSGVFCAMSPHQFKVLGFMLRNHPDMYSSESTVAKGCKMNKATIGHVLRGFVHAGLFSKTRRSKGTGLQSSNMYNLNDLTDKQLAQHVVASFSHKQFNPTMRSLHRGGKSAAAVDQQLVEQFRWTGNSMQILEVPRNASKPILSLATVESDPLIKPASVLSEKVSSTATVNEGQDILDWFKHISIRGSSATKLLAKVQHQGLSIYDLKIAYGELQADLTVKKPTSLLIHRINEGMIVPSSDYDEDFAEGACELKEEIAEHLLGPSSMMDDKLKSRLSNAIYQAMSKVRVWEATDESKDARTICRYIDKDGREERAMLEPLDLKQLLDLCVQMNFSICHVKIDSAEIARLVMVQLPNMVPTIEQLKAQYSEQKAIALSKVKAEHGLVWPADEPMPEDAAEQLTEFKAAKANAA